MNFKDFENFPLKPNELKLLKRFKRSDFAVLKRSEFKILRDIGFIRGAMDGKSDWFGDDKLPECGMCEITNRGRRYLLWHTQLRRERLMGWVRYWVTTVLASLSLVISFIALLHTL